MTALLQPVLLLLGGEVGREEEHLQLAGLVERVGELAELLADLVELVLLLRDLEQRAGVDGGDLLHGASRRSDRPDSAAKSSSDSASSTSRFWSSSVSVLRVTFSVASTVRSATSLRISWIARRVSCSMSRRVCAIISSRLRLASATTSASLFSAVLRARATISSAWPRASCSRSRYSASSLSASLARALGGVDRLLDRLLALVQRLRDAREGELAEDVHREAEDDQRPDHQPDVGRDEEGAPAAVGCEDRVRSLEEEGDEARHQAVEEARLGEREAEPLDAGDLVAHLGLAGDRLDHLAEDDADADAGADGAEAAADAEGDRLARVSAVVGRREDRERMVDSTWSPLTSGARRPRRRGRWQ